MKTGRGGEADQLVDEILGIIKQKSRFNVKSCKRLALRSFEDKRYFKSILFNLLVNHLLSEEKNKEKMLSGIGTNMVSLQNSIKKARKECYSYRKTLRLWVLPRMRNTFERVFDNAGGKSKRVLTLLEVSCKHGLEITEGYVDDLDAVEETLKNAIEQFTSVLRQDAKEMHLLGYLLNNLGSNCKIQRRPEEAKDYLTQAIEVKRNAKDYTTEEEQKQDIAFTTRILKNTEKMLRCQEMLQRPEMLLPQA